MLDLRFIRDNPDVVRKAIANKHVSDIDLDDLLAVDRIVYTTKLEIQGLQEERNANAKRTSKATPEERQTLIARGREINERIKELEPQRDEAEARLNNLMLYVPQIPSPDAPIGTNEDENVVVRHHGEARHFDFTPRDHVQLLEMNGWAELERVAVVSGSRSYALKNEMVIYEMALWRFAMDFLRAKGFDLLTVPGLVREQPLVAMGQFPKARDQVYEIEKDDLFLSGTAEVPTNSLHAGEILPDLAVQPITYAAFSPAFRREAGSSGKDVRGLIRVHQFNKVEQYVICAADPDISAAWHAALLGNAEEMVQALELPYRIIEACTGDMGVGKVRMNDIECWVPSENKYRETHSCSTLGDWQARRTNLRYRAEDGKVRFAHTLNNTALATPRILVPLLENHQLEDGSVRVPAALVPYVGVAVLKGKQNDK